MLLIVVVFYLYFRFYLFKAIFLSSLLLLLLLLSLSLVLSLLLLSSSLYVPCARTRRTQRDAVQHQSIAYREKETNRSSAGGRFPVWQHQDSFSLPPAVCICNERGRNTDWKLVTAIEMSRGRAETSTRF